MTPTEVAVIIGAALILLVGVVLLWLWNRSIQQLRRAAERFAHGDLSERLPVLGMRPLAELAEAVNQMAGQLQDRIDTVVQARNELEAVLTSMTDGLLAVDAQFRILRMNTVAARLLGIDPVESVGHDARELVRHAALVEFIADALRTGQQLQTDLSLRLDAESARMGPSATAEAHLQVKGAALRDASGGRIGTLILLEDLTRLRQLEQMRRDFVANVSHEIRTPVTAIRAAAETVLEMPADDGAETGRFLQIIARQSDRLHAIVEDLLTLARVEQDTERGRIEMELAALAPLLQRAVEVCQVQAENKQMVLKMQCPVDLRARINASLLEHAVVNLLDNAIKYSPAGTIVSLSARHEKDETIVTVRDYGNGIEAQHLPRLFERFYRTDRARSRALGGTGLGLAIVKHAAQAHGGHVSVTSVLAKGPGDPPDHGSTFKIHLPRIGNEEEAT